MTDRTRLLYVDLFCGAGGVTAGIEAARCEGRKCAEVVACVNHDANAIASHAANHPHAMHFLEDVRTLDLTPVAERLQAVKSFMPDAKVVLWASLECTNFSRAKGGQPRDPDSRTLAEHLYRYIEVLKPDYIQIENVEEFLSWGDVDEQGKPVSKDRGRSYVRWCNRIQRYGYTYDYRILSAADYGAYTTRKRYFGQFAKKGLPLMWPEADYGKVHRPKGGQPELFAGPLLKPWKPVREVLDLEDEGTSIFGRPRPLVEATLERIYAGLVKFVAGGKDAFLVKYNSMNRYQKYIAPSVDEPAPTVTVQQRLAVSKVHFLSKCYGGDPSGKNIAVDGPAGTVTTIDHHAFISAHYGNGYNKSLVEPVGAVTTRDKFELVSPRFLDMQYGSGVPASVDRPAWTVTGNPKHHLVTCRQYIMNPQFQSAGGSVDDPCFTLIARMDKRPPYLVTPRVEVDGVPLPPFIRRDGDRYVYEIYPTDSPIMVKIKEFMALYNIVDIFMRMLKIVELKRIMGFPDDYVLTGTQAQQKKCIGNAVATVMAQRIAETTYRSVYHNHRNRNLSWKS